LPSAAEPRSIAAHPIPRPPRPGAARLRGLLSALALAALLAACSGPPPPLPASGRAPYQLRYGLGTDSTLLISSPDLNRRLAEHRSQPALQAFATRSQAAEDAGRPGDLHIELSTPERDRQSRLKLQFAEEGRLLDRASLDTRILAQTWLLGFNAQLTPPPEETADHSFRLESEFSGLLGRRRAPAAAAPPEHRPAQASVGEERPPLALERSANRPAPAAGAAQPYYLAFHDASLGVDGEGTAHFLFSLGGYPAQEHGELVATFRLLSSSDQAPVWGRSGAGSEQALALGYTGHFSGWLKSLGHSLTYANFQGPAADQPEWLDAGLEGAQAETSVRSWQSRLELSCGADLPSPPPGLLRGIRLDAHLETQAALERTGLLPAANPPAAWGSQLRLNTAIGTLSAKLSRSASQHRLGFALQKSGLAGARARLYYEDIDHRGFGELETRIGGQLNLPLDESLLQVLTLGYWRRAEADLFAARPAGGYTAPRRGRHVSTLNNTTPASLQ
jgi:hypothetical protein